MVTTVAVNTITRSTPAIVALCFCVAIAEGFDIQAIGVAAPRLGPELGLSAAALGWVFAIGNIGLVIGASIGGWLADRIGRKPVFIAAVLLFGVFTLATAISSTFASLFAVRFLAGLHLGAAFPIMMAVATEVSTAEKRTQTATAMFCGMPLGGAASAFLTQAFAGLDWRVLFYVGGVVPIVLTVLLYWWMPETLRREGRGERVGQSAWQTLFGGGRAPATMLLWTAFLPTLLILYLILNWLPTLVAAKGVGRAAAPLASLSFNLASVAGALLIGWLVDRFTLRWPLTVAYAGLAIALVALSRSDTLAQMLVLSAAAGFCVLGANFALYGLAPTYYSAETRGTGSGASIAVGRVGSIAGPLLAGLLLGGGVSASGVVAYLVPLAVVGGAGVFALSFCRRPY
jgi:MFS transporter, AAHS family, 3-hydroxyphenylpropionic acid transporter